MNKKFKIIIGILLLILISLLIVYFNLNSKRKIIVNELNTINELKSYEDIDMNIKSKGKFYYVELALKEYYYDFMYNKSVYESNQTAALTNYLTPKYLSSNKNNLAKIKTDFNKKYLECQESLDTLIKMLNEDVIMSYISKYNLGYYYNELYKDLLVTSNDSLYIKDYENAKTVNEEKNKYLVELLDLLNKNKAKWYVKSDQLYIDGDAILKKYNELRNKIYGLKDDLV